MKRRAKEKPEPGFTWDQIDSARVQAGLAADKTPAHGFTIAVYAQKYGLKFSTAATQLARLAADGKLKTGRRRAFDGDGRHRLIRVYWPV